MSLWIIDRLVPLVFPKLNPLTRWLLASRLHPLVSWYVVVLRFNGRRSGRRFAVPLAYHLAADGAIEAVTSRGGGWWRNLRGGAEQSALFRGAWWHVRVDVVEADAGAIVVALRSRDACRRLLVSVAPDKTVLLRIHLLHRGHEGS